MKTKKHFFLASAIALTLFGAACKKNNSTPTPVVVTGVQLSANAKFGNILTDNKGFALYSFSNDAALTATCLTGCSVTWLPFYKENPSIGIGLAAADFGVITRTDNAKQVTYKGWPLYYYINDKAAGDVNGDGIGKLWFVAKADYTVMVANSQLVGADGQNYLSNGTAGTASSQYLTDANGHTLYMFTKDTFKVNKFSTNVPAHDAIWPIDVAASVQSVPSILDKTQFDVITVFGQSQLVFKGHPLYYFGQDAGAKGSTKGVSFPTAGAGIWQVTNTSTVALTL